MITRWYEVVCDQCGNARHYQGNQKSAEAQYRRDGGIVAKGKHYCDRDCRRAEQKGGKDD